MRLFALFSLVFVSGASAQQAPEPPKKARIEGSVVSLTGEPIPRAQIRLQGQISIQAGQPVQPAVFSATSDDAGKFAIEQIDPGTNYQLSAQRPGFVNARFGARNANSPAVPLTLLDGQVLKGISLTMTPQGVISGRVTDSNGDPIQNAQVMLLRRGYQRGVRQLVPGNSAGTNDQGDYRIANLTPGRYFLMVQDRQLAVTTGGAAPSEGRLSTYYPNGTDPQSAAPIDVAAGQELRGFDVRMRKGSVFSVRGKILGMTGAPGLGTSLLTYPKGDIASSLLGILNRPGQVRPDGTFEIRGLVPGTYTIQTISPSPNTGVRAVTRGEVTIVDSDVTDVTLSAAPGVSLTGTVRVEDGDIKKLLPAVDPIASAQSTALLMAAGNAGITIGGIGGGGRMAIGLTDLNPAPLGGTPPGVLKDDGSFTLDGIQPGKYQLNVVALPKGHYVKSANLGGTDVTRNPVDLTSGAGGTLNIVLSSKAADIAGVVRSEKNESPTGMTVTLWTRDPEPGTMTNGVRMAITDQNGGFQFQGLRPGIYYAAAWEDIENGLAQARDFVSQFTSEATKIELAEGGHSAIEVKLIPTAKIKAAEEKLP